MIATTNKLNILIVTFVIPYPANDGGKVYCFGYINHLRTKMNITLALKVYSENQLNDALKLKTIWPDVIIHIIDLIEKNTTNNRWVTKLNSVKGKVANLLTGSPQNTLSLNSDLIAQSWRLVNEKIINSIDQIITQSNFDIIQVEHTVNISLINILPKETKNVFVEIESMHLITQDKLNAAKKSDNTYSKYIVENSKTIEYSFMELYDGVFTLNNNDFKRIGNRLEGKKNNVFLSPYGVLSIPTLSDEYINSYKPEKLIFLGSELHGPNADAVRWFCGEIFPMLLQKFPSLTIHITGTWSASFQSQFKNEPNIIFTGFINDLSSFIKNSVMIVPIRLGGGGMRAKVLDGLANGSPIVSTELGCEGFEQANDAIQIANSTQEFIQKIELIIKNNDIGKEMILKGYNTIQRNFNFENLANERLTYYQKIAQ